jgi:GNAT superfamily N-acetyltransferase
MSDGQLSAPEKLQPHHELDAFQCGVPPLDDWLKRQAQRNEQRGASRTYVACLESRVIGYYCISMGALARELSPKPMQRNMPDPVPVAVLGRLAVDQAYSGRGIGSALLRDATLRVLQTADVIGVKAILVHAISEEARQFYLGRGFDESPAQPMTLCLLLETARRALI